MRIFLFDEAISTGHQVTMFDKNPGSKYPHLTVLGDIRDKNAIIKAAQRHDVIYHLAAAHADNIRPESLYYDINVGGAQNIVAAAKKAGIDKIIFTSSVAVYPLNAGEPDENSKVAPFNKYGESKLAAEEVFAKWASENNRHSLITIRPCAIFGEENRGNVYNLLLQIYKKRFILIGNGRNKKSIGYIGNFVKFLLFCLGFGPGSHLFNYADKPDLSANELVTIARNTFGRNGNNQIRVPYNIGLLAGATFDFISRTTGKTFPVSTIRIKKFCADTTVLANRILETGFKPSYTLKEALEQTIRAEFPISK